MSDTDLGWIIFSLCGQKEGPSEVVNDGPQGLLDAQDCEDCSGVAGVTHEAVGSSGAAQKRRPATLPAPEGYGTAPTAQNDAPAPLSCIGQPKTQAQTRS